MRNACFRVFGTLLEGRRVLSLSFALVVGVGACAPSSSPGSTGSGGTTATSSGGAGGQSTSAGTGGVATTGTGGNGTGGSLPAGTGGAAATGGVSGTGGQTNASGGAPGTGGNASASGGQDGGVDASATDDAKASGTGCTGLLFCDDFESYTTGAVPNGKWTAQVRGSAKAVIDTTMAYSGTRSVHFTGMVNQSSANIIAQGAPVFPIQGNTIFMRMMMYVQSYPATSGTHTRFMRIGTGTSGADGTAYALDTYNGTGIEHVNSGMFRDTSLHMSDALVKGKWVCWEWELDNTAGPPKGDTGTVMGYLWRDGTAVPLAVTNDSMPWNPIPWQLLEVGLEAYQSDTMAGDFWIDDVAINSKKIGCPTK